MFRRHRLQAGLRRSVRMKLAAQHRKKTRRYGDDTAPPAALHGRNGGAREIPRTREIDRDKPVPNFRGDLVDPHQVRHVIIADGAHPHKKCANQQPKRFHTSIFHRLNLIVQRNAFRASNKPNCK